MYHHTMTETERRAEMYWEHYERFRRICEYATGKTLEAARLERDRALDFYRHYREKLEG